MPKSWDFTAWATKNDIKCADGRTIRRDAFKDNDGKEVPLCWSHVHTDPTNVLGHALLENHPEGVLMHAKFNNTEKARHAKETVDNGDIKSVSIYANHLQEFNGNVMHGDIKEVSLVIAGANPGALILDAMIAHGDDMADTDSCVIFECAEGITLSHADDDDKKEEKKEEKEDVADKTVKEIFDSMTEEQKQACYYIIGQATKDAKGGDDDVEHDDMEEEGSMKHNIFDTDENATFLSHEDQVAIVSAAREGRGSLKKAIAQFEQDNECDLSHAFDPVEPLFPEYKNLGPAAPEQWTTDQGWITKVLNGVHKSPISRVRTRFVNLRDISQLRARGYKKGTKKKDVGNIRLISRTTDPTTVYVKSKLDRDDIIDITDFDYVNYMYQIDRRNLNEELATAILFGDGREDTDEDKIAEDKIRNIWKDDELYTIHADVDIAAARQELQGTDTSKHFGDNYVYAEAVITALLYAREGFKGSGTPDLYITPHLLNVMMLARDFNGRRIYDDKRQLAAALNVGEVITCEQMEGRTRTAGEGANAKTKKLLALVGNLQDYTMGATKGGEITHFTDFDIDYNQQKSLLETRCSGATTKIKSFIALEEEVTSNP